MLGAASFPVGEGSSRLVAGLVIDDFFTISTKALGASDTSPATAALFSAKEIYKTQGIVGSDVIDADKATCAGAEVDASPAVLDFALRSARLSTSVSPFPLSVLRPGS